MTPRSLLRAEGFLLLAAAFTLYILRGYDALTMALLFFAPDLAMLVYLVDRKAGAAAYNAVHTYSVPLGLSVVSLVLGWSLGLQLGLIWVAHIGMDRLLGFGLKYVGEFRDTHLGRV